MHHILLSSANKMSAIVKCSPGFTFPDEVDPEGTKVYCSEGSWITLQGANVQPDDTCIEQSEGLCTDLEVPDFVDVVKR